MANSENEARCFNFGGFALKIARRQKLRILPHSAGSVAKIISKRESYSSAFRQAAAPNSEATNLACLCESLPANLLT